MVRLGIVRVQFRGAGKLPERFGAVPLVEKNHASESCMSSGGTVIELYRLAGCSFSLRQRLEGINFTAECHHCVIIGKPGPAKCIIGLNIDGLLVVPAGIFISYAVFCL